LATSMGGFNHGAVTDKALAIALTLRGARVDIFLCNGVPGCHLTKIGKEPPARMVESDLRKRCAVCIETGERTFAPLGLRTIRLSELLTAADRHEAQTVAAEIDLQSLKQAKLDGWKVGEHALAGALRYFALDELSSEPLGEPVARQFMKAAVLTARGLDRLLARGDYEVVSANHGIYIPQGIVGEVARARGVRVVNWNPAYRRHCFIFSHGDTYHHTMISEDVSAWERLELKGGRRDKIISYLRDRRQASGDWIWFNRAEDSSRQEIASKLGLDGRPLIVALTSVAWDACLHYESNAFESLADWTLQTIAHFASRPDLQLVVRVHPAEVTGFVKSRAKMAEFIARRFPALPENVKVVPPEDSLSTYSLIDHANAVLVYSTKTGIEASAQGLPVVVAGEAWIRNKGFSYDAVSPESYRAILDQLPFAKGLSSERRERAQRYAYHFFFRRMIELPFLADAGPAEFEIQIESLQSLAQGACPGLDCICDGILSGAPFIYDAIGPQPGSEWGLSPFRRPWLQALTAAAGRWRV
ncbi:MAG TPA: capsule biosynthesis protein, partial [Caulobacteraceae bacterium]